MRNILGTGLTHHLTIIGFSTKNCLMTATRSAREAGNTYSSSETVLLPVIMTLKPGSLAIVMSLVHKQTGSRIKQMMKYVYHLEKIMIHRVPLIHCPGIAGRLMKLCFQRHLSKRVFHKEKVGRYHFSQTQPSFIACPNDG